MKPQKLVIEGLNSFEQREVIDFKALMQPGLFGIFGPTGSGKSSIIDGMTLALFGDVARGSKNFINVNAQKCQVILEFQIGTDNKKNYRVSRSYKRDKTSQNARADKARLELVTKDGESEILADQTRSVDEQCSSILGLSREDFTRTVILPQGKFSEFLQMGGKDRTDMLERIFRLEKFGIELDRRVKEYKRNIDQEIKVLEGQCQVYQNISPELLSERQEEYLRQEQEILKITEDIKRVQEFIQEWGYVRDLQKKLNMNEAHRVKLEQEKPQIEGNKRELENIRTANELYELYMLSEEAKVSYQKSLHEKENHLSRKQKAEKDFERALKYREEWEQKFDRKHSVLEKELFQIDAALGKVGEIKTFEEKIKSNDLKQKEYENKAKNFLTEKRSIEEQEAALRKKIEEYSKTKKDFFHTQQEKDLVQKGYEAEKELTRIEQELLRKEELHRERIQKKDAYGDEINEIRENQVKAEKVLEDLEHQIKELDKSLTEVPDLTQLALLTERVKSEKKIYAEIKEEQEQLQAQRKLLEEEVTNLRDEEKKWCVDKESTRLLMEKNQRKMLAHKLKAELRRGEPCPVCGSLHHELAQTSADSTEKLEEKEEEWSSRYQEIEECLDAIKIQLSAALGRVQNIDIRQQELQKKQDKLDDRFLSQNEQQLEENLNTARENKKQLEEKQREYGRKREEEKEKIAKIKALQSAKEASLKEMDNQIAQSKLEYEYLKTQKEIQSEIRNSCLSQKNVSSFAAVWKQFGAEMKAYEEADRALQECDKEKSFLREQTEKINTEMADLKQKQTRLEENSAYLKQAVQNLQRELNETVGNYEHLSERKSQTVKQLDLLEREVAKSREVQKETEKRKQEETEKYHRLDIETEKNASTYKVQSERLQTKMEESHITDINWIQQNHRAKEYIGELERKIKKYEEECFLAQNTKAELETELKGRQISEEEWNEKTRGFEEIQEILKNKHSQFSVLKSEIKRLKKDLEEVHEILKKLEVQKHQEALVLELDKILRGKAFVRYAALYYLKSVTRDANKRLREMTNGNYELELNENGEFIICDFKNGGKKRSCATLSGGETFVVSLALALSLSKQIQLKGTTSIDLFFLDEGFGTLDERFIDVVMDSLYRLQERGLHVGLITHVEAIKERVGARILVSPSEGGGHGSTTLMEFH